MLKTRIMPTMLWKDVGLVKGVSFDSWRRVGTVLPAIKVYNLREVDELVLLDISASLNGRNPDYDSVADWANECFVPLTVGGGFRDIDQIRHMLRAGADKISLNSSIFDMPDLITKAASKFGSQCLVASIDARLESNGEYQCYSHGGSKPTSKEVCDWAKEVEKRGAGEILLTSIDRDGTMKGYDLSLLKKVTSIVSIPVIASGGAGKYEDLYLALSQGGASAVALASIFHFTESTPLEAKEYLRRKGIAVRNPHSL